MPASIGVNLRVTGHCRQGGRKYMEDFFSVAYQQTEDEKDLEYAFFGIYDGHGGGEAATFAKEHLMESIVRQKNFWSDKDEDVLKAIKEGYIATHYAMWKEQEKWPKTASGLPSTAGTTASVAFIRRGKIYIGHVGDSGIILGYQEQPNQSWKARPLTKDHKPENESEMSRIAQCGGKVVTKSGVPRVVWNRPRIGHKGPVRRSTPIDEIPFLAVARSLGDLWSYNSALDEFVVSPDPDTCVVSIDADSFRCLIFGTDGLWNMISPATAVNIVQVAEQHNEQTVLATADSSNPQQEQQQSSPRSKVWLNPSKCLVERALDRWNSTKMRADNTSVITLMLDPPGPPRAEVIKNQKLLSENRLRRLDQQSQQISMDTCGETQKPIETTPEEPGQSDIDKSCSEPPPYPENGLEIVTVYRDEASSIIQSVIDAVTSEGTETPHHDTYLEKIHREVLNSIQNKQPAAEEKSAPINKEIIQINEVSSSSQEKSATEDNAPCARCTRSHDASRKLLRTSKPVRSSSESPKRKTRSVLARRIVGGSKREHSEPEQENGRLLAEGTCLGKVACPADEGRLGEAPGCSSSEPPQKLRRSRSLEPRDFTLRSSDAKSRLLRDRDRALAGRHSLATMVPASGSAFKRLSSTRSFTPLRSPIQTRNRVKRLSNK